MKGWSADGRPIFMPIVKDVLLRTLPTAIVPKRSARKVRGTVRLLN